MGQGASGEWHFAESIRVRPAQADREGHEKHTWVGGEAERETGHDTVADTEKPLRAEDCLVARAVQETADILGKFQGRGFDLRRG